jgi:hypothetical protein
MDRIITEIAEYSPTAAALAGLKAKLEGVVYEVTNATGMALAKFNRRELVTLRTDLEKKRVDIKAPALERCKLVDAEAKRITAELLALEKPIDDQIKVEESRKEAERAEKARIAAEAQAVLDAKIIEIGKLPLWCMGKTAEEIQVFLDFIISKEIGGEFTGETRDRAEAARTEAVAEIKTILAAMIEAEDRAAVIKAEHEAEAARLEEARLLEEVRQAEERVERDRLAAIERADAEKRQAILDEQKKANDEALAELDRQKAEFAAEQKIEADKRDDALRITAAKDAADAVENQRVANEKAAAIRKEEMAAAVLAEQKRIASEKERKIAEKKAKLLAAKCADAATAFRKILDICTGPADLDVSQAACLTEIALIAEAML